MRPNTTNGFPIQHFVSGTAVSPSKHRIIPAWP